MRARRSVPALLALSLLAAAGACRDSGDDGNNPNIDAGDGDATNPDDMTIQHVQDDLTSVGTAVTLRGVVVVAKDTYGNRTGNFYVMEPGGGEYSGVLVFGAPLDQFDAISVGDLVDITNAEKGEYAYMGDTSGGTVTELIGAGGGTMTVAKVGNGSVPAPHIVDALANGRLAEAERKAEQEKWEGVLIEVENVTVTRGVQQIGGSMPDPTFRDFLVTGYYNVDSSLAEIPIDAVTRGDCLASITGMGDWFFNYKILPRATSDIVTGGTNCPAPEADATMCADGIDNDANGFADCNDNSCRTSVPACTSTTTVTNIQNGTIPANSTVMLDDVIVTGRKTFPSNRQGLWVADAGTAALNGGVLVFMGTTAPDAAWTVGSHVSVNGRVTEFDNQITEITQATVVTATGNVAAVSALSVPSAATLSDLTTGEPYEGVLVQIPNVRVTNAALGNDKIELTDPTGGKIVLDDEAYDYAAADFSMGACLGSITGEMHWNNLDHIRILVPRTSADVVATGGTCN